MVALRALFRAAPASFEGRFTTFEGVSIEPLPAQPGGPPLWVGGRSAAALRTAGRLGDGWLPIWISTEQYVAGWSEIRTHAEAAGRDPQALVPAAVAPARVDGGGGRGRRQTPAPLPQRPAAPVSEPPGQRDTVAGARAGG